ncbi:E3 ubiquitin-protein ligase TRAIP-like isoform X2 [Anopheles funestus]|uniref:E3 ubiquitin-protein ligase TRAIP-like isoform X2 n=1 Tax=Anopheles funestus TaxID=62324 RepID=UPI0020C61B46|nr:E3 ubiquitin-protein ligase TRAIP-like isoform X2 [Anopheles funestus]
MNIECCVCTEAFLPSSVVNTTPCGHMFHQHCLLRWLAQSKTCPQCRKQCTPAQLIKMYFNVASNSSLEKQLENLTLKFRAQEALLKTLKNDATAHKCEQQKMSKTIQDLEKELRTKNDAKDLLLKNKDYSISNIRHQQQLLKKMKNDAAIHKITQKTEAKRIKMLEEELHKRKIISNLMLQEGDCFTSKIRVQEQLLNTLKNEAAVHTNKQQQMIAAIQNVEQQLRTTEIRNNSLLREQYCFTSKIRVQQQLLEKLKSEHRGLFSANALMMPLLFSGVILAIRFYTYCASKK